MLFSYQSHTASLNTGFTSVEKCTKGKNLLGEGAECVIG